MPAKPLKIVIIGSGNVASYFAKTFHAAGATILQVYSRKMANARRLSKTVNAEAVNETGKLLPSADLFLIAVNDDALPELAKQLSVSKGMVVHTAGSVSMNVLKQFPQRGVFYPLQTFSKDRQPAAITLCLEASSKNGFAFLAKTAQSIGADVYPLNSEQRRAAHLAAVFACNFTNHLYAIAAELLEEKKLPFALLRPLIEETAAKIKTLSPAEAQTGPALRGDTAVMKKHLALLKKHPDWKKIYRRLSEDIRESSRKKIK